jgi:hypothetical protein
MAQLERRASQQRLNATKAWLLARSGIEDALARLGAGQDSEAPDTRFLGEDFDASGTLNGFEAAHEVFRRGSLDTETCPLRHALRPSFFMRESPLSNRPVLAGVSGRARGRSGHLQGDRGADGNHYALKIESGGFYVNGGDPAAASTVGYNAVLRRMLGTLAEALDREDGLDDGVPTDEVFGFALVDLRPATGWSGLDQIRRLADREDVLAQAMPLLPYLTTSAWVDRKVIAVEPALAALVGGEMRTWADIKTGRRNVWQDPARPPTRAAPGFERIGGKIVGRAPVDLDWARHRRAALLALLSGLRAVYLDERVFSSSYARDSLGRIEEVEIQHSWVSGDDASLVADAILVHAGPLDTWARWNSLCETFQVTGTSEVAAAKRDLLKAAFNPNSALNKFNPNQSTWKRVDKSDLIAGSTEFSLMPLQGRRVSCAGRLMGGRGEELAVRTATAVLAPSRVVRLTTQREFLCDDLGDPEVPGDEGDPRVPGFRGPGVPEALSEGRTPGLSWGHALDRTGRFPGSWMDGDSRGVALQAYPEPLVDPGSLPSGYDGNVQLATLETPRNYAYGAGGADADMKLLARFDDGLDLDLWDSAVAGAGLNQADLQQAPAGHPLWHPSLPNTLYPDGCYSERDRSPAYLDRGNADGFRSVLAFWVKRNYIKQPQVAELRGRVFVDWVNAVDGLWSMVGSNQFFVVGDVVHLPGITPVGGDPLGGGTGGAANSLILFFETGHDILHESLHECRFQTADRYPLREDHRWSHVVVFYDGRASQVHGVGRILADEALLPVDRGEQNSYSSGVDPNLAADITLPDMFGPHVIVLGNRRVCRYTVSASDAPAKTFGRGSDATFDEFAIYDLGASPEEANALCMTRFREGRYYRGDAYLPPSPTPVFLDDQAGTYVSPLLSTGSSRIARIEWSWTRPAGLPGDFPDIEVVSADASSHLWAPAQSRAALSPGWTPAAGGWRVARAAPGPFRLRVQFRRTDPLPLETPILDSPVLDDLSVVMVQEALSGWMAD